MPVFAIANRIIFSQDGCEGVGDSPPFDKEFEAFLREIDRLLATGKRNKKAHSYLEA